MSIMKKVFLMGILLALVNVAMCQVSSTVKDLNVTSGFKLGGNRVIAISTDSSAGSKIGNFLITERAAKLYADGKKAGNDTIGNTGYLPIWRANALGAKGLQSVTDSGSSPNAYKTTNPIYANSFVSGRGGRQVSSLSMDIYDATHEAGILLLKGNAGGRDYGIKIVPSSSLTDISTVYFPNVSGIVPMSVNGVTANISTGDISIPVGSTNTVFGRTGDVVAATADYSVGQITGAAPLLSPAFSGFPLAPTQPTGTSNTTLATTQFVQNTLAAQSKDTTFITAASQGVLQVVNSGGKDSLGFKKQGITKFIAAGTDSNIVARDIVLTDAPWAVNTSTAQTIQGLKTFQGATSTDAAPLNSELLTTGSGTNWTGSGYTTGYIHTTGSTVALTSVVSVTTGFYYQFTYTITGRTTGSITITAGGISITGLTASGNQGQLTTSTSTVVVTPTTDFNGTLVLSVRQINTSTSQLTFANSSNATISEMRMPGANNTAVGLLSLRRITTGVNNISFGNSSMSNLTSGSLNSAIGADALSVATNASGNVAVGSSSLASTTTGGSNVAVGVNSFRNNTVGGSVVAVGPNSARFIADGVTSLTIANNSTFIGNGTRALGDGQTNQNVFGDGAIGLGSNTSVIGNSSTLTFGTWGNIVMQGTTNKIIMSATNTANGTVGAQTINRPSGKVNFAAAASTLVVTNSLVTTASIVKVQVEGTDATALSARVTLAAGSFTITLNAAATAETKVSFLVFN